MASRISIGLGVLTWKAHATLRATVATWAEGRLFGHFDRSVAYFQERTPEDDAVAEALGLNPVGTARNVGIARGMAGIADALETDWVLFLENDCPLVASADDVTETLGQVRADIAAHDLKVVRLRSRTDPGGVISRRRKYVEVFGVKDPLPDLPQRHRRRPFPQNLLLGLAMGGDRLRGAALYAEQDPVAAQPKALRRSETGNFLSDSRFLNWTNQSILVERRFFLDVMMQRFETRPDKRSRSGRRSLEPTANHAWWYRMAVPIGIADPGLFTHRRLDR